MNDARFEQCKYRLAVVAALMIGLMISATSLAENTHDAGEAEHGQGFHKNLIGGFIGITGEERRERALTLGIDYERRITEVIGVGFGLERALGDLEFTVLTLGLAIHIDKWKLLVAPGVEIDDFEKEHELIRLGIEYTFEMSGYELAPKFMVDFVEGDTVLIGGVSFFWGF